MLNTIIAHSAYVIITPYRITGTNPVKKGKNGMANKAPNEVTVKTYVEQIDKLVPMEDNPRKIGRDAYDKLKKSLQEFPEMKQLRELVVDENLQILGGNQRYYALKDLGYTDVTVKQVVGLTDKQKREFIIKDNTAAGSWDTDLLANNFDLDELKDWGVPDFGSIGGDEKEKEQPSGGDRQCLCPACGYEGEASEFNPNANN